MKTKRKHTRHQRRSEAAFLRKPGKKGTRKKREWKISPVTGLPVFIVPKNAKPINMEALQRFLRDHL